MQLFNLLETGLPVFGQTFNVSLNWIGKLIRLLCEGVGAVGVGIILFSLILKFITMPFDIYQRISMRKQNQQMKANQERMEKLQKQYANDKEKYNQKVMEMYKENGMSLFSSCLPMILSMFIFIIAINAFNAYAQYSNVSNYNTLINAYNDKMQTYSVELTEDNYTSVVTSVDLDANTVEYTVKDSTAGKFVYYKAKLFKDKTMNYAEMSTAQLVEYINDYPTKAYFVDEVRAVAEDSAISAYVSANSALPQGEAVYNYLVNEGQKAVVEIYNKQVKKDTGFGWIKNIWATDATYKHPVLSAKDFATEAKQEKFNVDGKKVKYSGISAYTNAYTSDTYNHVTAQLTAEKKAPNGFFVLIVLSVGTILLQQFVMQRSQKEQQKFSSVDGTGASQQKMTMIIMTVMFAAFSFMYSSAFSIYMITSNIFSLLSTLVINKIVDTKLEKQEEEASVKRYENNALERIEKAKNAGKKSAEESKKKK